jgi:uncharacterized membrane protein YcjF (UPF0283 family)
MELLRSITEVEMKCPHCQKEISEAGFVYCPHCGKQLEPSKKKGIGLRKGGLLAFMLWVGLTAISVGVIVTSDPFARREWDTVLAVLAFVFALAILYVFGAWAIYTVAKRQGHNAVRWTTAAIVFSPVLAWAVYGLTWRKS